MICTSMIPAEGDKTDKRHEGVMQDPKTAICSQLSVMGVELLQLAAGLE